MAHSVVSPSRDAFPPELVRAVAHDAACDADLVVVFLDALGLSPAGPDQPPRRLPAWFLLELGAALRLWLWECHGMRLHREAGLPPAEEALRGVFGRLTAPAADQPAGGTPLSRRVLALFVEHFAWSGRADLDADLVLGEVDEDALVEVLANLVWAHRAAVGPESDATARGT